MLFFSTVFGGLLVSHTPYKLMHCCGFFMVFWVMFFKLMFKLFGIASEELRACNEKLELNIQLQSFSVVVYQQEFGLIDCL